MSCIRRWTSRGIDRDFGRTDFTSSGSTGGSIVRAQTGDIKLAQVQLSHATVVHDFRLTSYTTDGDMMKAAEALAGTIQRFLLTNLPAN